MSLWSPTHVQFTVLRARNLIAKGKGGNNDVFVTIQLGKEKYQTSTIKNALNPEWFEECDLPIPHMRSEVEVSLYHRGVLSDDFLGYASVPIWEHKITESAKSIWVNLHNKPNRPDDSKYRGELEVKLTFHCQSRSDIMSHGLKKRSSSIRNIASAFGDKFKLTRSRSFRENRRDPEGGKVDKNRTLVGRDSNLGHDGQEEALTRSYSMSAAYIKSMSLDRTRLTNYAGGSNNIPVHHHNNNNINSNNGHPYTGSINLVNNIIPEHGVSQAHSQSMYNLPGNRRSCAEIPFHQPPPLPYDLKHSSQDDSALMASRDRRVMSDYHINSAFRLPLPSAAGSSHFEPVSRRERDRSGIYESIKERTEPENSGSSDSDPESVPMPKARGKRHSRREVPVMGSTGRDYGKENVPTSVITATTTTASSSRGNFISAADQQAFNSRDQQAFNSRDSGILDDRSSSQGNSLEGSLAATDLAAITTTTANNNNNNNNINNGGGGGSKARPGSQDSHVDQSRSELAGMGLAGGSAGGSGTSGGLLYHLDREMGFNSSGRSSKCKVPAGVPSQFYSKENSQGELVVRKRSRGQRDRLRQMRQGNRRYTVQGLDHYGTAHYEDSTSEPSDASRTEVPEDLISVFKNMTREELLRVVITSKAQMIRKDQYIRDLENYIDDLLVRVMETTPRLLSRPNLHRL